MQLVCVCVCRGSLRSFVDIELNIFHLRMTVLKEKKAVEDVNELAQWKKQTKIKRKINQEAGVWG